MASQRNGTLYIGVTSDLVKRIYEHKHELADGFTKKYGVKMLVYYEQTNDIEAAIHRETQMKKWNRKWKLELIEKMNPDWKDFMTKSLNNCHSHESGNLAKRHGRGIDYFCAADAAHWIPACAGMTIEPPESELWTDVTA